MSQGNIGNGVYNRHFGVLLSIANLIWDLHNRCSTMEMKNSRIILNVNLIVNVSGCIEFQTGSSFMLIVP